MKNIRAIILDMYKDEIQFEKVTDYIYKVCDTPNHRIALRFQLENDEDSQYPLEDILEKYWLNLTDHNKEFQNSEGKQILEVEFEGSYDAVMAVSELIGKRVYNIEEGGVVSLVIEGQEETQKLNDAVETAIGWTPWQALWIEETLDYPEVVLAYEKLMDECSFEDIRQLRELVLAMSVAYSYIRACFADESQGLEDAIVMSEAEKSEFYQTHYQMVSKSLKEEGVISEKLIITLRKMIPKGLIVTEVKAFLPQLTYEHLIISIYHPHLIAGLKDFFGQQFEKIALSDGQWFNIFTAHLDVLFTRAFKEKETSRDIFSFGKWMNDFIVRLHEFPKYATNLKQPLPENRTFKVLTFSQLIKDLYSNDSEINQLIVDLKAIKEPDITIEKLESLLKKVDTKMIQNAYFLDFSAELMKYLHTHRPFIAQRQHLFSVVKEKFERLQHEINVRDLNQLCHLLNEFEQYMKDTLQKNLAYEKEVETIVGKGSVPEGQKTEVEHQKARLKQLYDELRNEGRFYFWVAGMPNQVAKHDVFCLDYISEKWKIYYTERGVISYTILETDDLEEAMMVYKKQISSFDHDHCVAFVRTQEQLDAIKAVLDENDIENFQNNIPETVYQKEIFRLFVKNEAIFQVEKLFGKLPSMFPFANNEYLLNNPPIRIDHIEQVVVIENPKKRLKKGQAPTVTFKGNLQGIGESFVEINGQNYLVMDTTIRRFKNRVAHGQTLLKQNKVVAVEQIAQFAYEVIVENGWYEKTWNQNHYFQLLPDDLQEVERKLKKRSAIVMAIVLTPLIILMLFLLFYDPR